MLKREILFLTFIIGIIRLYSQSTIGLETGYYNPLAYSNSEQTSSHPTKIDSYRPSLFISLNYTENISNNFYVASSIGYKNQLIKISTTETTIGGNYYRHYFSTEDYENNFLFFELKAGAQPIKKIPVWVNLGHGFDIFLSSKKSSIGYSESSQSYPLYSNSSDKWNDSNIKNKDASAFRMFFLAEIKSVIKLNKRSRITVKGEMNYSLSETYKNIKTLDLFIGVGYQFLLPNFTPLKKVSKDSEAYELSN